MSYTVKFKELGTSIWRTIKDVVADDIIVQDGTVLPVRVLILKSKIRMEVPMSCIFEFSKERALEIEKEKEATRKKA